MSSHPNKDIAAALKYAAEHGWEIKQGGAHAWGKIYCPYNEPECRGGEFCIQSIWSTPKNAGNHAKQIRRVVDNCIEQKRLLDEREN
jgi:hypothetical protein